jgi:hypothetical protein
MAANPELILSEPVPGEPARHAQKRKPVRGEIVNATVLSKHPKNSTLSNVGDVPELISVTNLSSLPGILNQDKLNPADKGLTVKTETFELTKPEDNVLIPSSDVLPILLEKMAK